MQGVNRFYLTGSAAFSIFVGMVFSADGDDPRPFMVKPENTVMKKPDVRERRPVLTDNAVMYGQSRKLIEVLTQVWETREGEWADSSRIVIVWDGDKDTARDYYFRRSGSWVHDEHLRFTYTANDSLNDAYSKKWVPDSSKWLDYFQEMFTYDPGQGYLIEDYIKLNYRLFDPDNAALYPAGLADYERYRYTYNSDRLVSLLTIQEVLTNNFVLSDSRRESYTYDANKNLSIINIQLYNAPAWVDTQRITVTYNANNQIVKDSMCTYNRTNRTWTPHSLYVYAYSSFDSLESITLKRYRGLLWADTLRRVYDYYSDTRLESKSTLQKWDAGGGTWLNVNSDSSVYNGNDIREYVFREYEGGEWVNRQRIFYTYESSAVRRGRDTRARAAPYSVDATRDGGLRFICNTPSLISAVVYDMKGDALKTLACERSVPAGEHTLSWDGTSDKRSAVAPGWYFCRLKINTATIYTHLTLLK